MSIYGKCQDFKSSNAARTAAITNAEKVHSLPFIAFSTPSTTSLGNLIVSLIVGGFSEMLIAIAKFPKHCIQDDCDELMDEFEAVKLSCGEKYPVVKKWFLDTFKNEDGKFDMAKAKREITGGKIEAAKVRVKAARKAATITMPKVVNQ